MRDTLRQNLQRLNLTDRTYRALLLLPLIEVAWADGRIQAREAAAIEEIAKKHDFFGSEARDLLQRWLSAPPTREERELGMRTLVELARRREGAGASFQAETLKQLVELSCDVASIAGGFFGLSNPISAEERACLDEIASVLHIDDGSSWTELISDLT